MPARWQCAPIVVSGSGIGPRTPSTSSGRRCGRRTPTRAWPASLSRSWRASLTRPPTACDRASSGSPRSAASRSAGSTRRCPTVSIPKRAAGPCARSRERTRHSNCGCDPSSGATTSAATDVMSVRSRAIRISPGSACGSRYSSTPPGGTATRHDGPLAVFRASGTHRSRATGSGMRRSPPSSRSAGGGWCASETSNSKRTRSRVCRGLPAGYRPRSIEADQRGPSGAGSPVQGKWGQP